MWSSRAALRTFVEMEFASTLSVWGSAESSGFWRNVILCRMVWFLQWSCNQRVASSNIGMTWRWSGKLPSTAPELERRWTLPRWSTSLYANIGSVYQNDLVDFTNLLWTYKYFCFVFSQDDWKKCKWGETREIFEMKALPLTLKSIQRFWKLFMLLAHKLHELDSSEVLFNWHFVGCGMYF